MGGLDLVLDGAGCRRIRRADGWLVASNPPE